MSGVGISLLVFGIYLIVNGLACAFAPNTLLGMFGQPPTSEPWIRNAGVLMLVIGYYYLQVARADLRPFYMWTVYARLVTFAIFVLFIVLGWAPATLGLFAAIDLLGAIWTYLTFRSGQAASA
jgi:hypothetical protein